jgi:hypothetical protein
VVNVRMGFPLLGLMVLVPSKASLRCLMLMAVKICLSIGALKTLVQYSRFLYRFWYTLSTWHHSLNSAPTDCARRIYW